MSRLNPIDIGSFWLPNQSSTIAPSIDRAYYIVLGVSVFFFVLVIGAASYLAYRYRKGHGKPEEQIDHNTKVEVIWTAIPSLMLLGLFGMGLTGFVNAHVPPGDAMEIKVTGERWLWTFTYANGTTTVNEMAVPRGKPVKLLMSSKDIIHSFFVPEFRVKQDVVPGAYTTMWFEATEAKDVQVLCAEYCGTGHSDMMAKIMVMEEPAFKDWLDKGGGAADLPPAELGKKLFTSRTCSTCHSLDGTRITGPSLKDVFGRTELLEGGGQVVVDENYVRESILDPQAKIVKGYPATMPTFRGLLKDKEIDGLIAFLKTQTSH